jgi:uncharacterized protein HemY
MLMIATMTVLTVMLVILLWVRRVLTDRPSGLGRWSRRRLREQNPGRSMGAP